MVVNFTPLPKKTHALLILFSVELVALIFLVAFFYSKLKSNNNSDSVLQVGSPTQHNKSTSSKKTFSRAANWKTYTNSLYGYSINYPPEANIIETKKEDVVILTDKAGKPIHPEIKNFDLSTDLDKAIETIFAKYTGKVCIKIEYKLGYVFISAKDNNQNKIVTCSEFGLRKNLKINQESVTVGSKTLTASGVLIDDARGNNIYYQKEFFHIELDDGNGIEYGTLSGRDKNTQYTFEDYLKIKKELLQIVQSYKKI